MSLSKHRGNTLLQKAVKPLAYPVLLRGIHSSAFVNDTLARHVFIPLVTDVLPAFVVAEASNLKARLLFDQSFKELEGRDSLLLATELIRPLRVSVHVNERDSVMIALVSRW